MCIYNYHTFTNCEHSQPFGQIEICQDFGDFRNYIEDLEDVSGDYGPPLEPDQCRRFRKKRKNEVRGRCSSCETFVQSQLYPGEDIELQDFQPQEEAAASDSGISSDDEQSVGPIRRSSVIRNPLQRPHTAHLSEDAALTYVREVVQTDIPDPFALWQAHAASRGSAADRTGAADEAGTRIMVNEVSRLVEARRAMVPPTPPVAAVEQTRVADETMTRDLIEDVSRCAGLVGLPPYAPHRYTMHQRIIIVSKLLHRLMHARWQIPPTNKNRGRKYHQRLYTVLPAQSPPCSDSAA